MKPLRLLCLALIGVLPLLAWAQWQWIDQDGRRVFCDCPPPPNIQAKNILQKPAGNAATLPSVAALPTEATAATAAASSATGAPGPAASAPRLSGKDKELEARKKASEAAEAEQKKTQADALARARAENCERARKAKATLDSGTRIATTNAKGEREVMDDAARAVETKRLQGLIASQCAPA
jgi:hypothetical protein